MSTPPNEAPLLPNKLRNVRALWVVLIIMALLAGCALLFARGSMRLSNDWQSQLSDTLTVQVMLETAEDWEAQTALARESLSSALPGTHIAVLPQARPALCFNLGLEMQPCPIIYPFRD